MPARTYHNKSLWILPRSFFIALLIFACGCARPVAFVQTLPNTNDLDLVLQLRELDITSNHTAERDVAHLLPLETGRDYTTSEMNAAIDSLRTKLSTLPGYPFASVANAEIQTDTSRRFATLSIRIDEGLPAVVDTLHLEGPFSDEDRDELRSKLRHRKSEPFQANRWTDDLEILAAHFEAQGYPFVSIQTDSLVPDFRQNNVGITLSVRVFPGRRVRIQDVAFAGNDKTNLTLLQRIAAYPDSTLYSPELAERGRLKLQRTGWFSKIEPPKLFQDFDGNYGLLYTVHEQPTTNIAGALGYVPDNSGSGGFVGTVDVRFANLMGTGRAFDIHWQREDIRRHSFHLSYSEPFVFGSPIHLAAQLGQEVEDSLYVAFNAQLRASTAIKDRWELSGELLRRNVSADSLASGPDSVRLDLFGGRGELRLDTRDNPLNPHSGALYTISSQALHSIGGDGPDEIYKNAFSFEQIIPFTKRWVSYVATRLEEAKTTGGVLPTSEWIRFGGAGSVRGYAEKHLAAPRAGWANIELRTLLGPVSRFFLLADIAALDRDDLEWKSAYGLGIQLRTGPGIFQVAVAAPAGGGFSKMVVHAKAVATF